MTLNINLDFIKKQTLSSILIMASIYAAPLIIAVYLYKYESASFASYALFVMALFLFIVLPLFTFKKNKTQPNGFSVPTISDYPTIQEAAPLPAVPRNWSIRLLSEIEWKKFEELCLGYFSLKDVYAELIPKGTNGYIELRLDGAAKVNAIVKHKTSIKDIGVKDIKALLTLMAQLGVSKGFYMTPGSFSDEAKAFAKENKVTLISGGMLLTMLKRLRNSQQKRLLNVATEGDYRTPTCPSCNVKMISRHGPHQDKYYWGCIYKPRCKHIRPRREQRQVPRVERRSAVREGQQLAYG